MGRCKQLEHVFLCLASISRINLSFMVKLEQIISYYISSSLFREPAAFDVGFDLAQSFLECPF